jgi:hypothetical protein
MCNDANEIFVRGVGLNRTNTIEALNETRGKGRFRRTDRTTEVVIEFHRNVSDSASRDVGRDIHFLATHDPHLNNRAPSFREETEIGRREAGILKLVHELGERLLVIDPAEELPDRPEVLDRVDERRAGERHHERFRIRRPDAAREGEHVLGTLRLQVLDEMRLIDDHPLESEPAEPSNMAVENFVVDDHHVAERVDILAVAVHDGCRAPRSPQLDLARPVGLDHVGHDHQQGVRV